MAQLLGMYHRRIEYPQNKIVELESRRAAGGRPEQRRAQAALDSIYLPPWRIDLARPPGVAHAGADARPRPTRARALRQPARRSASLTLILSDDD